MQIIDKLPYKLSEDDVLSELKIRNISDKIREIVMDVINRVRNIAQPKAVFKECFIDEKIDDKVLIEGIEFKSHILSVNVKNVERVFPYVVTAGNELDGLDISSSDMFASYTLDIIKELVLEEARLSFEKLLYKRYNLEDASYMSPGSLTDWPISEQKKLFKLLGDVKKAIGVELLDTYIMKPVKTVSGIYFPTKFDFKSCMLCPRENCPSREAPFDPKMYEEYTGKKIN